MCSSTVRMDEAIAVAAMARLSASGGNGAAAMVATSELKAAVVYGAAVRTAAPRLSDASDVECGEAGKRGRGVEHGSNG